MRTGRYRHRLRNPTMAARSPAASAALRVKHEIHGVVVSAGLMQKTVKVRIGGQQWNSIVHKTFSNPKEVLVHDANSSLRTGDVVAIAPGWRTSKGKRHYVKQIIAPFREPLESRPPVLPLSELIDRYETKRAVKMDRKATRQTETELRKQGEKKKQLERI
ncbi:37S ribosomal protein S17 [Paramyrothecium foliicola]|nr:37S ribosomal protein S17 [Paramyrothecium foliicola]